MESHRDLLRRELLRAAVESGRMDQLGGVGTIRALMAIGRGSAGSDIEGSFSISVPHTRRALAVA